MTAHRAALGALLLGALLLGGRSGAVGVAAAGAAAGAGAPPADAAAGATAATGAAVRSTAPRAAAAASLPVTIDAIHPAATIPSGFVGLSFETPTLGSPAITSAAAHLPSLLRPLGAGVLRFAGDSADHTQWLPVPAPPAPWAIATITPAELDNIAALARTTGWRVVLGLNLGHPAPAAAADEARAASAALGPSLAAVEIGNEPDLWSRPVPMPFRAVLGAQALRGHSWNFASYTSQFAVTRRAVTSAAPTVPLYGPATATSTWLRPFAAQQTPGPAALTQHYYPFDRCHHGQLLAHGPSIGSLLSRRVSDRERRQVAADVAAGAGRGLPVQIDETNSVACGGQPNTSDTFASALWAVDFGLTAARGGAAAIDFHGGLGSCAAMGTLYSPWYSPLCAQSDGQLRPRPEYYGLMLLSSLEGDAFVPAAYHTSNDVTIHALRAPDGTLRVVIDDMDTSATAPGRRPRPLAVTLHAGSQFRRASVIRLSAPSAGAKHSITLGGASVAPDGSFGGTIAVPVGGAFGVFTVTLAPASAAVVTLGP